MTIAANPPTAAGTRVSASSAIRRPRAAPVSDRSTHGSPAYPSSKAHWPRMRRSATNGFHA